MKTDAELKQDVIDELVWDASVNETRMGVSIKSGVVTLSGTVDNYAEKIAAEKATKKVKGVKAVAMDIEVRLASSGERTDVDIAEAALNSLKWNSTVPKDAAVVKVENGWVTLEGSVNWNYQKEAARKSVESLVGVKGVSNLIEVKSAVEPTLVVDNIKNTFKRSATIEADNINVQTEGHKVILTGKVSSMEESKQAEDAAWSAQGVWQVENKLVVTALEIMM